MNHFLFILSLVSLTACSSTPPPRGHHHSPETVLITYHVKSGKEAEFQDVLARAWETYRKEHLVFAQPHVIVQDKENGGKNRFVEIFTWVSHAAPDHAPDSVKKIWEQMQSLCEARDGHRGLEGGEVELLAPKLPERGD
jgi:quinol monooxygenase YgiN